MIELQFQIALSMLPGIGHVGAKKLVAYCGGAEAVFKEKKQALEKIPGIGKNHARLIQLEPHFQEAEREIERMEQNAVQAHFFLDKTYPQRLLHCEDGPLILYSKGLADLNPKRCLAIVGTRKATVKGKLFTEKFLQDLAPIHPTIVSGLAYGIDVSAHRAALKVGLQTHAVLAHGLDSVSPRSHTQTAESLLDQGALLSDYRCGTEAFPHNFAARNRIVAGMVDAVVVIESSEKGGSLITAELANGYNRDVFALPGRHDDSQSRGCNRLIKMNRAALLESAKDIEYILGWETQDKKSKAIQRDLFVNLEPREELLLKSLQKQALWAVDELSLEAQMPMSEVMSLLLTLEFKGLVRPRPGKVYESIA